MNESGLDLQALDSQLDEYISTQTNQPEEQPVENEQGIIFDTVDAFQRGTYQGLAGIAETSESFLGVGEDLRDWAQDGADDQLNQMSHTGREAMNQSLFEDDGDGGVQFGEGADNWRSWVLQSASVVGQYADMLIPGKAVASIGLKAGAKIVGKTALKQAAKKGMSKEAAESFSQQAMKEFTQAHSGKANVASFTALGTAMAGGQAGIEVRGEVMNTSDEVLDQSQEFSKIFYSIYDVLPPEQQNDPDVIRKVRENAKLELAEDLADKVQRDPKLLLSNAMTEFVGGKFFDGILRGTGNGSRIAGATKGVATEGATEAIQGGVEQYAVNEAVQEADHTRGDMDGVLANAANEGVMGGMIGGATGAAMPGIANEDSSAQLNEPAQAEGIATDRQELSIIDGELQTELVEVEPDVAAPDLELEPKENNEDGIEYNLSGIDSIMNAKAAEIEKEIAEYEVAEVEKKRAEVEPEGLNDPRIFRDQFRQELQLVQAHASQWRNSKEIDPSKDSVLEAVTKLGGISKREAVKNGIDSSDIANINKQHFKAPFTDSSNSLDNLAESLSQHGYLPENYESSALLDLISSELNGSKQYSNQADFDAIQSAQRFQAVSGDLQSLGYKGFPRAMQKALEGKKLGSREAQAVRNVFDVLSSERKEHLERNIRPLRDKIVKLRQHRKANPNTGETELSYTDLNGSDYTADELARDQSAIAEIADSARDQGLSLEQINKAFYQSEGDPVEFGYQIEQLLFDKEIQQEHAALEGKEVEVNTLEELDQLIGANNARSSGNTERPETLAGSREEGNGQNEKDGPSHDKRDPETPPNDTREITQEVKEEAPPSEGLSLSGGQEKSTGPSDAQKEAGNYKKKHIRMHGLEISIENEAGSTRSGIDEDGNNWSNLIHYDYGDIKGTKGADGDNIDVFIGKNLTGQKVFIVNQNHSNGEFDEHKVMLGFNSKNAAETAYLKNYDSGWDNYSDVIESSVEGFRAWLKDGDHNKPFSEIEANNQKIDIAPKKTASDEKVLPSSEVESKRVSKPRKTSEKLEDTGEILWGAKKHLTSLYKSELEDADIVSQPLSKLWPKKEVDSIENLKVAAFAYSARAEIPPKPRKSYKLARWVESVKIFIDATKQIEAVDSLNGFNRILEKYKKSSTKMARFAEKVELLTMLDRSMWDQIDSVEINSNGVELIDGKHIPRPYINIRMNGRVKLFFHKTKLDEIIDEVRSGLSDTGKQKKEMKFEVRGRKGSVYINKKGDKAYRRLMEFTGEYAVSQARTYIKDNNEKLIELWEGVKAEQNVNKSDIRPKDSVPRTGKDHRKGRDISAESFAETFGFRGVQFGNWVKQGDGERDRQGFVNQAYDAFMDLAEIIGVPEKALSLNGQLGIAFGARGRSRAMAHFEPSTFVINLTKNKGAGSLAHEWFHALDSYLQGLRNDDGQMDDPFLTAHPENYHFNGNYRVPSKMIKDNSTRLRVGNWKEVTGLREEVADTFKSLVDTLKKSAMHLRASKIDKGKAGSDYWSSIIEVAARSFENYVQTKMLSKGYNNDFLAAFTSEDNFTRSKDLYPYHLPSEMESIENAFDDVFSILETKETDKGLALYRVSDKVGRIHKGMEVKDVKAATEAFIKAYKGADDGIDVRVYRNTEDAFGREAAEELGRIKGAYDPTNNRLILIAANLSGAKDAKETLQHEVLVHKGLGLFSEETQTRILDAVVENASKSKSLKQDWDYIQQQYADKSIRIQSEELIAKIAEKKLSKFDKYLNRLMLAIRDALKAIGLIDSSISRRDLLNVIYRMGDAFREGKQAKPRNIEKVFHSKNASSDNDAAINSSGTKNNPSTKNFDDDSPNNQLASMLAAINQSLENPAAERDFHLEHAKTVESWIALTEKELGIKVNVVPSVNQLPIMTIARLSNYGYLTGVKGVYEDGEMYLVANRISNEADAVEVTLHEALGHHGVMSYLGKELEPTIKDIYKGVGKKAFERYADPDFYDLDLNTEDGRRVAVLEYIAHSAETGKSLGVVKRFIAAIKKALRKIFPSAKFVQWSDIDVLALIDDARQFMRNGDLKGDDAETLASIEPDEKARSWPDIERLQLPDTKPPMASSTSRSKHQKARKLDLTFAKNRDDLKILTQKDLVKPSNKGDTLASLKKPTATADNFNDLNDDQEAFLNKIGRPTIKQAAIHKVKEVTDSWRLKVRQGLVDRYAALMDLDKQLLGKDITNEENITSSSWVRAKMSNVASGVISSMMNSGRIYLDPKDKVIDVSKDTNGLVYVLNKLGGSAEIERFMGWVAANRASKLMGEGRENLFSEKEIAAGAKLNLGTLEDGRERQSTYNSVFKEFQIFRDDVLAIAEQSGVITHENRSMWSDEFYVPFYRIMEDMDEVKGPATMGGLSRQQAYKKLKGGDQQLNDLLENTIMNFHHLIDASMKNIAAKQAIDNATSLDVAQQVPESAKGKQSTFVLKNGQKVWYDIEDPLVFAAITSLAHTGFNGSAMKVMRGFKRIFTSFTTASPQFIIANLIRDSLHSTAVSDINKNAFKNISGGLKSYLKDFDKARLNATGGAFNFGHMLGEDANAIKWQVDKEFRKAKLISGPEDIHHVLRAAWDKWQAVGNVFENVNRASVFKQNETKGKLFAAYQARDLMDFSAHGAWPAIRVLIDVVPFLNARLQGLDKMWREGIKPSAKVVRHAMGMGDISLSEKKAAMRFTSVAGTLALASIALYLHNQDDEEYQKLEDWQRDTYWFFRIGEHGFFIPKPFEIGAMATMAERLTEQLVDDKVTGELFAQRLGHMLSDTFSFNPVPQAFQPVLDVYSNKDAFTGRDIESSGMERLSPSQRSRANTTSIAKGISSGLESTVGSVLGKDSSLVLSPVQVDHLIGAYLGWLGATVTATADVMVKASLGETTPEKEWHEFQPVRRFYRDLSIPGYTKHQTEFYDQLKEVGQIYSDIRNYQRLGETEKALALMKENQGKLKKRALLNKIQRQLQAVSSRMKKIQASDKSGEWKRRELDRLKLIKQRLVQIVSDHD